MGRPMKTSWARGWIVPGMLGFALGAQPIDGLAQGLTKVTIGYSATASPYLPLKIAEEAKLFEKHGLEANIVLIQGGSTMMKALLAGEVTAAFIGGAPVILARVGGGDAKIVLAFRNTLVQQIVAGPHLQGKINRVEDLKGKRAAISSRGSESESVLRLVLKKYGIPAQEITFLQIGGASERFAALKSGTADVTVMTRPLHLQAIRSGFPVVLDLTKEQIEWFNTGIAMRENWVRREPHVALAVVKTIVEATYYGWANKAFTKKALAKYMKTDDDEMLELSYRDFVEYQTKDFRPSLTGVRTAIEEVSETNPQVKELVPEEVVNLSLLMELERSGFLHEMRRRYSP